MKRILMSTTGIAALAVVFAFTSIEKKATTYTVATDASKVTWTAANKGGPHSGTFPLKSGQINVDNGKLTGGTFVIDLANLKADAGGLETHLKTKDFFDVATFTEAVFTISNVSYTNSNTADITGNLSLHGATAPVKFTAMISASGDKVSAESNFSIDRTSWGINYGPGNVDNAVKIGVTLVANK